MAKSRAGSVLLATADADTFNEQLVVCGVKVVGGAGGMTVNLKHASTSGVVMYSTTVGNSSEKFEEVCFSVPNGGLYVNISAGGGTVYIYTK
jgi:hypothetical protein